MSCSISDRKVIFPPLRAVTASGPAAQILVGLATRGAAASETDIKQAAMTV